MKPHTAAKFFGDESAVATWRDVYWIDTSVLVESHRTYHRFDIIPQFWGWLDQQLDLGS